MTDTFESDEAFLGYVEIHSQTRRALFHVNHVIRFMQLAGIWQDAARPLVFEEFLPMHWADIEATMRLARKKLAEPKPTATIIPFPRKK